MYRIIALAQSIRLDVSLDNEDPSFGMGMAMETETETRLGNEAGPLPSSSSLSAAGAAGTDDIGNVVRVDTLALAGQRMVIDIELAHPCNSARNSHTNTDTNMSTNKEANVKGNGNGKTKGARGKGWTANSLRVERVDPEHLNLASTTGTGGEGGMNDVDNLPPLLSSTAAGDAGLASSGSAIPGTRVLEAQSLVLEQYLQKYLDAVNRYNDSERHWHMYHETLQQEDDDEDEESLELQAERAILAFGDQLADLRAVDLKMQPLDAPVEAAAAAAAAMDKISRQADVAVDVDMDAVKPAEGDDVVLWDQLNEIHSLLK
ncbi:hypothetical protein QFC24_004784 [Naganishia onofrii]|uniref:Uncharacterized protein n=1 Tax=Naganishia onofrii TaxID=1851511 RepID=A0ACC2XCS1_9TREE|nr:hypothetical protein QFC24_004784 [Naganishia onofrii]